MIKKYFSSIKGFYCKYMDRAHWGGSLSTEVAVIVTLNSTKLVKTGGYWYFRGSPIALGEIRLRSSTRITNSKITKPYSNNSVILLHAVRLKLCNFYHANVPYCFCSQSKNYAKYKLSTTTFVAETTKLTKSHGTAEFGSGYLVKCLKSLYASFFRLYHSSCQCALTLGSSIQIILIKSKPLISNYHKRNTGQPAKHKKSSNKYDFHPTNFAVETKGIFHTRCKWWLQVPGLSVLSKNAKNVYLAAYIVDHALIKISKIHSKNLVSLNLYCLDCQQVIVSLPNSPATADLTLIHCTNVYMVNKNRLPGTIPKLFHEKFKNTKFYLISNRSYNLCIKATPHLQQLSKNSQINKQSPSVKSKAIKSLHIRLVMVCDYLLGQYVGYRGTSGIADFQPLHVTVGASLQSTPKKEKLKVTINNVDKLKSYKKGEEGTHLQCGYG